eukprot:TRINITY_DN766_c0_g1_i10.p1 TRINITY_DN766_c0_g1~~TRINITY_DN766_c0_g1_i10.p1  ORF type:complete len:143 (+),score=11.78 TRINITY_DN766_c0_g1_i10:275-703(+)
MAWYTKVPLLSSITLPTLTSPMTFFFSSCPINFFKKKQKYKKQKYTVTAHLQRLHSAARNGEIEEVRRLTQQANAALNEPDASGCTPLHYAVLADSPVEICEILISQVISGAAMRSHANSLWSQGAQVDAQNNGGIYVPKPV